MRSLFHSLNLQMQNTQVCYKICEREEVQRLESSENQWLQEEHYKQNLIVLAEPKKRTHETWRSSYARAFGATHTYIVSVFNVVLISGIKVNSSSTLQRIWSSIEFKSTNIAWRIQGLICKTNGMLFYSSLKFCLKELAKYLCGSFLI